MNFFIKTLIILLSALTYNSYSFSINVNKHYSHVAGNILNINKYLKRSYPEHLFKSITYYNNNKSICYTFDSKNKVKYLMKDKYNYLISFDIFKYKYLIKIKSTPINYNSTFLDIDIRLNKNVYHNFTKLSYKHYLCHYSSFLIIFKNYFYVLEISIQSLGHKSLVFVSFLAFAPNH